MLGFSAFSETTFAQPDGSGAAIADVSTTLVQAGVGSISVIAKASLTPASIELQTLASNISADASSQFNLASIVASISTPSLATSAKANKSTTSLVSTLSVSAPTLDAKANNSVGSILGSFANNIDFDAEASITTGSVTASVDKGLLSTSAKSNVTTSSLLLSAEYDSTTFVEYSITVASTGYGNKYYVDSVVQQQLYLQEGQTYRFDQSDSSNSNHPLKFSTTSNGTHASGSEYTTGVVYVGTPGNAGAYTEITVASGAPKLYYYCINHSGMGGTAYTPSAGTISLAITVVSTGQGNKYYIDGTSAYPTISLTEGSTYRFDQSASSNSGHPLRFSTTSGGTHAGGSEYTTGVTTSGTPGSSGAYTEITVATGAPTLYYYCTIHSGMGGQLNTPSITTLVTETGLVASVKGSIPVTGVVGAINNEELEAKGGASLTPTSLLLSSGLTDFTDEDAQSSITLTSVSGTFTNVLSSPTTVQFPYQNFANDYSRQRTLYIISPDKNNTVHIPADPANRTVFIQSTASSAGNRTVKIAA